jgi:hypothetical protein
VVHVVYLVIGGGGRGVCFGNSVTKYQIWANGYLYMRRLDECCLNNFHCCEKDG